jgi:hypothetical protein
MLLLRTYFNNNRRGFGYDSIPITRLHILQSHHISCVIGFLTIHLFIKAQYMNMVARVSN